MDDLTTMLEDNSFDIFLEYKNYIDEINNARRDTKNKRTEFIDSSKDNLKGYIPLIINKFHSVEFRDLVTPSDKDVNKSLNAAIRLTGFITTAEASIETIFYCLASGSLSLDGTMSGYAALVTILVSFYSEIKFNHAISRSINKDLTTLANDLKGKII